MANPIIFGKDLRSDIVNIEITKSNKLQLFYKNGEFEEESNYKWILSNKNVDGKMKRLKGNSHYKYIKLFSNPREYFIFLKKYKKTKDLYYSYNEKEAAMIYKGITLFKNMKHNELRIASFDIETNGLRKDDNSLIYIITNAFRDEKGNITKKLFSIDEYSSQKEMIKAWEKWIVDKDPDVICGHNIISYDLPFIAHCLALETDENLCIGRFLEPMEINSYESHFRVDGNQKWPYNKIHIYGRHIIDTMHLAVKYDIGRKYPSWNLKEIVKFEGLCSDDRQFYDAATIKKHWNNLEERTKIKKYAEDDALDALKLYDLMSPPIFYMTQSVPKCYQEMVGSASGSQLNSILVRAYLSDFHSIPKPSEPEFVAGGISFGNPGIHKNVFKIDVKSMYPSIIRSKRLYSINKDPKKRFLEMVDFFTEERFKNKELYEKTNDKYYDDLQASQKIFINSSYGLNGTPGLNFNDFNIANEITKMARNIIKETIKWATNKNIKEWFSEYKEEYDD